MAIVDCACLGVRLHSGKEFSNDVISRKSRALFSCTKRGQRLGGGLAKLDKFRSSPAQKLPTGHRRKPQPRAWRERPRKQIGLSQRAGPRDGGKQGDSKQGTRFSVGNEVDMTEPRPQQNSDNLLWPDRGGVGGEGATGDGR